MEEAKTQIVSTDVNAGLCAMMLNLLFYLAKWDRLQIFSQLPANLKNFFTSLKRE